MSLNTAHRDGGVLIHSGEYVLLFSDKVTLSWSGQDNPLFKGNKTGRLFLTTHRMIFNAKGSDPMQSFSFPLIMLSNIVVEQPPFGANYIAGKIKAQPNDAWEGEAKFKLVFYHGGAIDFWQALAKAADLTRKNANMRKTENEWYPAPPPVYDQDEDYYGWIPPAQVSPNQLPSNTVFINDSPPPYPGINTTNQSTPGYSQDQVRDCSSENTWEVSPPQTGYYDPRKPQMAYVFPPTYYENPPSYDQATKKNQ